MKRLHRTITEVIQHYYVVSRFEQRECGVRTDVTSTAGHQNFSGQRSESFQMKKKRVITESEFATAQIVARTTKIV
ncbi:hypothetical protein D3C85_1407290 [compost metagenome]